MDGKDEMLTGLRASFDRWEEFLSARSDEEITARPPDGRWSVADVIAHLMAWQQISSARLEAALRDAVPEYPAWLAGADPFDAEDHLAEFNARVHEIHRNRPWPELYRSWREGFLRFLELGAALPQEWLQEPARYRWMRGYALEAVLEGSREHHEEHYAGASARFA